MFFSRGAASYGAQGSASHQRGRGCRPKDGTSRAVSRPPHHVLFSCCQKRAHACVLINLRVLSLPCLALSCLVLAQSQAAAAIAKADKLMAVGKKEYNTIDDAIASYELALTQETHDEPQKAKTSQLLRVAQVPPPPRSNDPLAAVLPTKLSTKRARHASLRVCVAWPRSWPRPRRRRRARPARRGTSKGANSSVRRNGMRSVDTTTLQRTFFLSPFDSKNEIILPRQARDTDTEKHSKR
eukprot:COSAG06_NODE_3362_length_5453_cov_5.741688_3_plen_240_part_00